jgi:hypothetical protein
MQAIEFEATAYQHSIKIPETVPDGVPIRVLLLIEDRPSESVSDVKTLLTALTDGLTDEDLMRPRDSGREPVEWDI